MIRDGSFSGSDITLDDPFAYQAGEPFWSDQDQVAAAATPAPAGRLGESAPRGRALAPAAPAPDRPTQPPPTRARDVRDIGASFFKGASLTDGADLGFYYDRYGTKLSGRTTLTFDKKIKAGFHLDIRNGAVTRADLSLDGGFGIRVAFEAGLKDGQNIRATLPVPVEFSFPIDTVLGVPLSLTIGQWLRGRGPA